MMRSMFSGVSGLRAHQTRMDVIGNNIANVNTVGFKSSRATFQEIFSETLRGASAPDATTGRGGTNPMQIGLGVDVGSIDLLMTRGSLQRTDNPTDMSIEGDGFFICRGGNTDTFKFTRAGNFGIDKLGNLVTGSGMNVYGWQKLKDDGSGLFDTEAEIEPLNLYTDDYRNKRIIPAKETTFAKLAGNLDASRAAAVNPDDPTAAEIFTMPMTVYDKLGNAYEVNIEFYKTDADEDGSTWGWRIPNPDNATAGGTDGAAGTLTFTETGVLDTSDPNVVKVPVNFAPDGSVGTDDFDVTIDFSKLTCFANDDSVKPSSVDGYTAGSLVTFSVGSDGILTGIYDNGQQQALAQVALTGFDNAAGLQKVGEIYPPPTPASTSLKRRAPTAWGR